jgi:photosystem II stability/assembly factor-like uncharacterized protein
VIAIARLVLLGLFFSIGAASPGWTPQTSGVNARLRGVSAVSDRVIWASGANGTILRTSDGGRTWQQLTIPDTNELDFRDIDAVSDSTAWVLSIGPGEASRIYKTVDAGAHWTEQFVNHDPKAFLDAMAFWDANRGVAVSDSVDGRFVILVTRNGGSTWSRVPLDALPPALPNEGAFAASGTNVTVVAPGDVWIGTGAAQKSRVLHSRDGGKTWTIADTPLATSTSAGIFSIAFRDSLHGIIVGGDYRKESETGNNAAVTSDGGATWIPVHGLGGFRSVVAYLPKSSKGSAIAVGPTGADLSDDDGRTWKPVAGDGYHAFAFARAGHAVGWGVGEHGRIGRMQNASSPRPARL